MRYGALLGVMHQAIWVNFDRPSLLALYGAMLGISEIASAMRDAVERHETKDDESDE